MTWGDTLKPKPVIVGVDPGTTVGLAFLDVHGHLVDLQSKKNLSPNNVITRIQEKGNLLILASDKRPLPEAVRRIGTSFDCKIYTPPKSLSVAEKKELTRDYDTSNRHEADALAAALKAYNAFSAKLRQIKRWEGKNFEKNVKRRLFGERPEPETIEITKKIYVEKPVEKYEKRIEKLRSTAERHRREAETRTELLRMREKRIHELESRPSETEDYLKSLLARSDAEKRDLESRLDTILSAYRAGKLEVLDMRDKSKVISDVKDVRGERYTEDPEVFEWCVEQDHPCTLIKILHMAEPFVYYHTLREHRGKAVKIDKLVEEYRRRRRRKYLK